jgi:hypothetical protein
MRARVEKPDKKRRPSQPERACVNRQAAVRPPADSVRRDAAALPPYLGFFVLFVSFVVRRSY